MLQRLAVYIASALMNRIATFQALAVISALLQMGYLIFPFLPLPQSPITSIALEVNGIGGNWFVLSPVVYNSFLVAKLASTVGLFLFRTWGRTILAVAVALNACILPFAGILAVPAIDNLVLALLYLSEGALLALAFSSPLRDGFNGKLTHDSAES